MFSLIKAFLFVLPTAYTAAVPEYSGSSALIPRADNGKLGFDISAARDRNFFTCMYNTGYKKVAIRIYQQACGHGVSNPITTATITSPVIGSSRHRLFD